MSKYWIVPVVISVEVVPVGSAGSVDSVMGSEESHRGAEKSDGREAVIVRSDGDLVACLVRLCSR